MIFYYRFHFVFIKNVFLRLSLFSWGGVKVLIPVSMKNSLGRKLNICVEKVIFEGRNSFVTVKIKKLRWKQKKSDFRNVIGCGNKSEYYWEKSVLQGKKNF